MKRSPSLSIVALVGLLILLLTGQNAAQGYVWCVGEDGHAALEFAFGDSCGPGPERDGDHGRHEGAPELSAADEHCGPCIDLQVSVETGPTRSRDSQDLPPPFSLSVLHPPAYVFAFSPVLELLPDSLRPPSLGQSLRSQRTVVLLI